MKKIFLLSAFIFSLVSCSTEQPVPDADIPLAEHPRPDFERLPWLNLNGYWQFAPDSLNIGEKESWQDKPGSFSGFGCQPVVFSGYYRSYVLGSGQYHKNRDQR